MMRLLLILSGSLVLSGCASAAAPNLFAGRYYMAGDSNCKRMQAISSTRIACSDKKGRQTGYRDAMTSQDLQVYQMQMLNQRAQIQQLSQSLEGVNQSFQNAGQQVLRQSQQFSPPQVQPIAPYGPSGGITYRWAGNTLIGSNGVTYRQVGSSIMGSDGTRCQIAGPNIVCR